MRFIQYSFIGFFLLMLTACGGGDSSADSNNSTSQKDYSKMGDYKVKRYPETGLQDNYLVYYPDNGITEDTPVILFLEGGGQTPKIDDYSGLMQFLASQGYFVIGAESGASYHASYAAQSIFEGALNTAIGAHNLNVSRLAVMGHSLGGGQAFYVMKYFRDKGYGDKGSLILSLDGWFAFDMDKTDLQSLDSTIAFLQMNGLTGTGTDPRIHLSIWKLATNSKKYFLTLPHNNHGYSAGSLNTMLSDRKDFLQIIGALTNDVFTGKDDGYKAIPAEYKTTFNEVFNALKEMDQYPFDCEGVVANAISVLKNNNINYCAME